MSLRVIKEVIFIAMGDEIFRQAMVFHPDETLAPYDLSYEELKALRSGDKKKMIEMGLEENLAEYGRLLFSKQR
jgi:hypothetical protein